MVRSARLSYIEVISFMARRDADTDHDTDHDTDMPCALLMNAEWK